MTAGTGGAKLDAASVVIARCTVAWTNARKSFASVKLRGTASDAVPGVAESRLCGSVRLVSGPHFRKGRKSGVQVVSSHAYPGGDNLLPETADKYPNSHDYMPHLETLRRRSTEDAEERTLT